MFFSTFTDCPTPFQPPAARLPPQQSVCLPIRLPTLSCFPPTVCHRFDRQLSVCPPTVRRHFDRRLSVYPLTVCRRFICRLPIRLSIRQSIHSCFSRRPLTAPRRFDRRLPVYSPTVRLPVRLPTLSCFPPTVCHRFNRQLSVCPPTVHRHFDRRLSVYPLTVCCRFIRRLPVCLSTLVFLNVH